MTGKKRKAPVTASKASHAQKRGDWITQVALHPEVKLAATGVASIIAYAYWHQGKNHAWFGVKDLKQLTNTSIATVERQLRQLTSAGFLRSEQQGNGDDANRYFTVDFKDDWFIFETEVLRCAKLYKGGADASYLREQTAGHLEGHSGTGPSNKLCGPRKYEGDSNNTLNDTLTGVCGCPSNNKGDGGSQPSGDPSADVEGIDPPNSESHSQRNAPGHALAGAHPDAMEDAA